ncbi:NAD(P)H-binding protein [Prescottella equi]
MEDQRTLDEHFRHRNHKGRRNCRLRRCRKDCRSSTSGRRSPGRAGVWFPEAWRERRLPADEEYYFSAKKDAEVALAHSALDWVILRPSLLTDEADTGLVALGPAEVHGQIGRGDVSATLARILHEPSISRQILELNEGNTRIDAAVSRMGVELGWAESGATHPSSIGREVGAWSL